jgi:hypothetical protein
MPPPLVQMLFVEPALLSSRKQVVDYFGALHDPKGQSKCQSLFEWKNEARAKVPAVFDPNFRSDAIHDATFEYGSGAPEALMCNALLEVAGVALDRETQAPEDTETPANRLDKDDAFYLKDVPKMQWLWSQHWSELVSVTEFMHMRDIIFLFKYFLEPLAVVDRVHDDVPLQDWRPHMVRPRYHLRVAAQGGGKVAVEFGAYKLKQLKLGFAWTSWNLERVGVQKVNNDGVDALQEGDVLRCRSLPKIEGLDEQAVEFILCAMTTRHVAIPLLLELVTSNRNNLSALLRVQLQALLDTAIFEPLEFGAGAQSDTVPLPNGSAPASHYGLLVDELRGSPESVFRPLLRLGEEALDLNRIDPARRPRPTFLLLVLYFVRLAHRVCRFAQRIVDVKVRSFMYRYILRESCSQFDSLPLTSLTIFLVVHFSLDCVHFSLDCTKGAFISPSIARARPC